MPAAFNDPRLSAPQCSGLKPVQNLHENPWFTVRDRGGYFTTEYHHSQVVVLPVVASRAVIMVRAKRPVIADSTLELPAGSVLEGETPQTGAVRELFEETGVQVQENQCMPLFPISNSPNRNPQLIHIFQVNIDQGAYDDRCEHDDEIDEVMLFSFGELGDLILNGSIFVSVPLAVLSTFLLRQPPFKIVHRSPQAPTGSPDRGY